MNSFKYTFNKGSENDLSTHLLRNSDLFLPPLTSYVNIETYTKKIFINAEKIECWHKQELVGLLAYYKDTKSKSCFITNLSIDKKYQRQGIGKKMVGLLVQKVKAIGFIKIELEVNYKNISAINFYKQQGFQICDQYNTTYKLEKLVQ